MKVNRLMTLICVVEIILCIGLVVLNGNKEQLLTSVSTIEQKKSAALQEVASTKVDDVTIDNKLMQVATKVKVREVVYDNMTLEELGAKLEKSMNSTLDGKGYIFAKKSIEKGIDPYLALAISLHETGCKWGCSTLAKKCYNIGGQKGGPGCFGGPYKKFNSLDEGIDGFLNNIARNYASKGLNTAKKMNPVYAENPNWHIAVNKYINEIKAK